MKLSWAALFAAATLSAQSVDVIGVHNLAGGGGPVNGQLPGSCRYCHAPHNGIGGSTPLWNQKLSKQVYTLYTSSTYKETDAQPAATSPSLLCLSCHDGTVAPGQTQAYGTIPTSGQMKAADVFGRNLQQSHPIDLALPIKDRRAVDE